MRSDLKKLIYSTAARIQRRYHRWVETEDLRQEMWVWAYAQPKTKLDELPVGTLLRRLWDVGLDYARREKATRSGYDPDDEAFYSITTIRELLPWVLDPDLPTLRGVDDRQTSSARRSAAGPAMDLETVVVDLRKAYSGLDGLDRRVLKLYVDNPADGDLPTFSEVNHVLRKMQRALGGRKPRKESLGDSDQRREAA